MVKSWGFIGGGRVTRIVLGGLERAGRFPREVTVSDINREALERLKRLFPSIETIPGDNRGAASRDIVVLAVHYPVVAQVLEEIKDHLKEEALLLSFAPRFTINRISQLLGGFDRIVRMVPNAPSLINMGYNPVAFSPAIPQKERQELLDTFQVLGECPQVQEEKLEAYVIMTGMGPTYFWFQWAELLEIARELGLSPKEGEEAILHMLTGAARTLYQSGLAPEEVMDLIPARPLAQEEEGIKRAFREKLIATFRKLKGE